MQARRKRNAGCVAVRILVAEDELVSRSRLFALLKSYGECDAVSNGMEAWQLVRQAWKERNPYHLLFLDIEMPQMDGMTLLRCIRETEDKCLFPLERKLKIIMITAHNDRDTIVQCVSEGCTDYIVKPLEIEVLKKKLMSFCPRENPVLE